ncbi:MAG: tetratricopeptide repeat protein [Pseudomonadota bacterium]
MNDYATEEEQVEELQRLWGEYGNYIIAGIVLGIAALIGWNRWSAAQQANAEEASDLYRVVLESVRDGERDAAVAALEALQVDHAGSTVAEQAWLAEAKLHMDAGDADAAVSALNRVLDSSLHTDIKTIARLRLAQIHQYAGQADDAYAVLQPVTSGYQRARVDAMLGDIELDRGNVEAARVAYEAALAAPPGESGIDANFVRLKLAALPPPTTSDADASAAPPVTEEAGNVTATTDEAVTEEPAQP